jgi:hypothetical protein
MCWKEKIQWQSVTNGLRKEHVLRFLMVICNSLNLLLKSLPINIINCIKFYVSPIIFLFIHNHLTLRKWCYTPLLHDFAFDLIIPPFDFHFSNICHVTTRKLRLPQCIMGDDLHIKIEGKIVQ